MDPVPMILYGKDFWQPLIDFVHTLHSDFSTISHLDESSIHLINSPEELEDYL
jgi:predicted Rossmann-fold nucleotide-binding protein